MQTTSRTRTLAVKGIVSLVVALVGLLIPFLPGTETIDRWGYDRLLVGRVPAQTPTSIIVVAIDDLSLEKLQRPWPLPRGMYADLLDRVFAAGAKAVALDLEFRDQSSPEQDRLLWAALRRHPSTVLAAELSDPSAEQFDLNALSSPAAAVTPDGTRIGITNLPLGPDDRLRETFPAVDLAASFASQAALAFDAELALPASSPTKSFGINFFGPAPAFEVVSFSETLENDIPAERFKDKLVFVGVTANVEASSDTGHGGRFQTPYSVADSAGAPSVEIQATIAANLLSQGSSGLIREFPRAKTLIIALLLAVVSTICFFSLSPLFATVLCLVLLGLGYQVSGSVLTNSAQFLPLVSLLGPTVLGYLASPFYQQITRRRERGLIRGIFARYLAPRMVEQLTGKPGHLQLGGESVEATVLFLDIAGCTALSERLPADEFVTLVNRCLSQVSEVVFRCDGMIDKYIGDGMMAVWGVPVATPQHASLAARAALEMRDAIAQCSEDEHRNRGISFSARIGVASGPMIAGNIGGGTIFNYTVLGPTVNFAAHLKSGNKEFNSQILINETLARSIVNEFELREVGSAALDEQSPAQRIFELVSARVVETRATG